MLIKSELPPVNAGSVKLIESPGEIRSLAAKVKLIFVADPAVKGSKIREEFANTPTGSTESREPGAAGRLAVSVDMVNCF
jgi:hypothetical protein